MTEVAFCKSFLTALDARPVKLSSDHIADARQYPAQSAYTLPRLPHPPHPAHPNPKSSTDASSSTAPSSISISLKPLKPSFPTVPLSQIDVSKTSIFDLKQQYAKATSIPAAKVKILYKKKPATDSKIVAEIIGGDAGGEVEFGVMVMGGVTSPPPETPGAAAPLESEKGSGSGGDSFGDRVASPPPAVNPSGKDIVATDEFWTDLTHFVLQRIKDEAEGQRLVDVFKTAWEKSK